MPCLIQKMPDGSLVRQWELREKPMVFGRGQDVENNVDDREMSRRHFIIEYRNHAYFIKDLGTTNGTSVNDRKITETELNPGDRIRAGQTIFVFDKGLGTIIGELAKEKKGFRTQLREVSKEAK
jgi:pSer/pThr/pTyr-binding forkhead associated (FHA) protein